MDCHHVAADLHAVCLRVVDSGLYFGLEVADPAVLAESVPTTKGVRVMLIKLLVANCAQLLFVILQKRSPHFLIRQRFPGRREANLVLEDIFLVKPFIKTIIAPAEVPPDNYHLIKV